MVDKSLFFVHDGSPTRQSSTAIAFIAGLSRLLLTLLPFAAFKTIKTKFNRKWHAAHFVRLQTPPHIADFYERELSEEMPVEPDCRAWCEIDTPEIQRIKEQCPWWSFGRMIKSKTTLKMGRWPPWGNESAEVTASPTSTGEPPRVTRVFKSNASRTEIWNEVIAWTINLSRERTGLEKTSETIDVGHKPWKRWTVFYLPRPYPGAMRQIEQMSLAEREKLYELRRWFAKEKLFVQHLRRGKWIMWTLIWLPVIMFGVVAAFSLERVPFTGRFRLIMLSPEEEEGLTDKLRGPGWYRTVLSMFTTAESPAPPVVPMADWRWNWVNGVMRRLERGLEEHCRAEREGRDISQAFAGVGPRSASDLLPPPPPDHPLHPRSRGSAVLHGALEGKEADRHIAVGPPYALLLLDNEERNAMSYGFGEGGSGGVVVYTGILDEILSSTQGQKEVKPVDGKAGVISTSKPTSGIWQFLFGRSSSGSQPSDSSRNHGTATYPPEPTEEQTLQLALVLAHELSHLVLSHHLESLSWSEIVIPGATGLGSDLIRTILYPVT
jgi:Zn-dependent protease with chaperone function